MPPSEGIRTEDELTVILNLLHQLDAQNYIPTDLYPPPPPPPSSKYLKETRGISEQEADSIWSFYQTLYEESRLERAKRSVDSSKLVIALTDLIAKCLFCDLVSEKEEVTSMGYLSLIKNLQKGTLSNRVIDFNSVPIDEKFILRDLQDFPDTIFSQKYNFLFGGIMTFSRFYVQGNQGVIYFDITRCDSDCAAGYIALLKKHEGRWVLEKVLRQWIT